MTPQEALRYHVTGAVERGEAEPIMAVEDEFTQAEAQAWREAYYIAVVGASNPVSVAGTLGRLSAAMLRHIGTHGVETHPALRAIAGHLAYLYGYGLGPDSDVLDQVEDRNKQNEGQ